MDHLYALRHNAWRCIATSKAKESKIIFCCALEVTSLAFDCFRLQLDPRFTESPMSRGTLADADTEGVGGSAFENALPQQ